jgi:hypothetical protein
MGLFTFGTGIMVGLGAAFAMRATMPRATELVGLMMQKMGFELGDILLALWDPEAHQAALPAPVAAIPPPKKRYVTGRRSGTGRRNRKSPVLGLARRGRTGSVAHANGKAPRLTATRRTTRSGVAARLN